MQRQNFAPRGSILRTTLEWSCRTIAIISAQNCAGVYGRGTNTVEKLREELQRAGVPASRLEDDQLRQMLERVTIRVSPGIEV